MSQVSMTVNGKAASGEIEGRTLLVEFLRETLGLTGTHVGCDTSQCGACVVHVDGKAVKACTMFAAEAEGAEVATIEGHGGRGRHAERDPTGVSGPSRAAMRILHAGHGDVGGRPAAETTRRPARPRSATIWKAISAAAPGTTTSSKRSWPRPVRTFRASLPNNGRVSGDCSDHPKGGLPTCQQDGGIGASSKRREDVRFLTGNGNYTDDINMRGQAYVHFLRSDVAHGTINSVDTQRGGRYARRAAHLHRRGFR